MSSCNMMMHVNCGSKHTVILTPAGIVFTFGSNYYGQLGDSSNQDRVTPNSLLFFAQKDVLFVDAGANHTFVCTADNTLYAFGSGGCGQLGVGDGQNKNEPTEVTFFSTNKKGERIRQVSGGGRHSLFLLDDGSVYSTGSNDFSQLGKDKTFEALEPKRMDTPDGVKFQRVSAGRDFSVLLARDGSVYVCGDNSSGQLGLGDRKKRDLPTKALKNLRNIEKIVTGPLHCFFINNYKELYATGGNSDGMLGLGDKDDRSFATRVKIKGKVKDVYTGLAHTFISLEDRTIHAIGNNKYGQFGFKLKLFKKDIAKPIMSKIEIFPSEIACGDGFSVFFTEDEKIYVAGSNKNGQVGMGDKKKTSFTELKLLNDIIARDKKEVLKNSVKNWAKSMGKKLKIESDSEESAKDEIEETYKEEKENEMEQKPEQKLEKTVFEENKENKENEEKIESIKKKVDIVQKVPQQQQTYIKKKTPKKQITPVKTNIIKREKKEKTPPKIPLTPKKISRPPPRAIKKPPSSFQNVRRIEKDNNAKPKSLTLSWKEKYERVFNENLLLKKRIRELEKRLENK